MLKKKYLQHKETIHNFFWRALQIAGKQGTTFAIFFIAAYFLIPEQLGLFSYLMALVGLLIIACDFGLSLATSKYVAEYKTKNSQDLDKILFSVSLLSVGLATLISLFVIFAGKYLFKEYILLLYLLPYLFFFPLTSILDGVYRGLKEFRKLSIITVIISGVCLILSFFLIKNYLLVGAMISQNILFILLTVFLFAFRKETKFKANKIIIKNIGKYALIIGITSLMFFLYTKADIIILKYFGFVEEIGYYEIINKIFQILIIPFMLFGQVIAPNITKYYTQKNYSLVIKKLRKHFILGVVFSIILTTLIYFCFPILIKTFLDKYFTEATILIFNIIIFILPLRFIAAIVNHGHTLATGNAHFNMIVMIPAGIANILLDFYFIYLFGFIGVIYSTLVCYSFATISFMILYYLKLNRLIKDEKNKKSP